MMVKYMLDDDERVHPTDVLDRIADEARHREPIAEGRGREIGRDELAQPFERNAHAQNCPRKRTSLS